MIILNNKNRKDKNRKDKDRSRIMEVLAENRTKYTEEMFIELQKNEWLTGKKKMKILCYILMSIYIGFGIFSIVVKQFPFMLFFFAAAGLMLFFVKKGYYWTAKMAFKQIKKSIPQEGYHYLFFKDCMEMKGENDKLIKRIPYDNITKVSQTQYSCNFFMDNSFFMVGFEGYLKGDAEKMMKIVEKM